MSLVGSLEDLGLSDILQIISLSRKSGVLLLRSDHGEGQVLFRDGRVTGAFSKGQATDLRTLLVGSGAISEDEYRTAVREAQTRGTDLETALCALPSLGRERLEALREQQIEQAAFTMFSWPTGEFSFEVRDDVEPPEPDLCPAQGIDAQYLAMEGARLRDEAQRDRSDAVAGAAEGDAPREGEAAVGRRPASPGPAEDGPPEGAGAETERPAGGVEPVAEADGPELEVEAVVEAEPLPQEAETELVVEASEEADESRSAVPVIVIDPDLAVLEWAKRALADGYGRVHIFQKTELAIARIRQYLVRRERPVVVVSEAAPPDPNSGARTPAEIVQRLKGQAPRMSIALLAGAADASRPGGADVATRRPDAGDLYNPRRAYALEDHAESLRRVVAGLQRGVPEPPPPGRVDPQALRRLKEVSARLRAAAPRGEIIPVLMRYAAEHFSRVALFLVRDELAVGMAGLGLETAGGPDDRALREVAIPADLPASFREVLARRASVRGPIRDDGDRRLVRALGAAEPEETYVAPLESGDRVVALLYADNLPHARPIGDTAALEVVLHEAGLALDRAALERQLADAESRDR